MRLPEVRLTQRPTHWPTHWTGIVAAPVALVVDLLVWGGDGATRFGPEIPAPVIVVATTVAYSALLVGRRRPVLAYAVLWVHAVVFAVLVPSFEPTAGLLIALYQCARLLGATRAATALTLAAVPFGMHAWNTARASGAGSVDALVLGLLWCVVVGVVWLLGRFSLRAQQTAQLRHEKLLVESALALSDQRVRLARDLHDVVASAVTLMVIQTGGARKLPAGDERIARLLESVEATGTEAMRELREMLHVLTPSEPDLEPRPATTAPLAGFPALLTRVRAAGVTVEASMEVEGDWPEDVQQVAYRVAQESLTNVVKHSGAGSRCQVSVTDRSGCLEVEIVDDGRGSPVVGDHLSSGLGLAGLRERVLAVGGELHAGPLRPGGFRVRVVLPSGPAVDPVPTPAQALTA